MTGVEDIGVCAVANPADRSLFFDSTIVTDCKSVPRRKNWNNRVLYATGEVLDSDLLRLLLPGDWAYGPSYGKVSAVQIKCEVANKSYHIVRSDAWNVKDDFADTMIVDIQNLHTAARHCGITPMRTLASTVRHLYMEQFGGQEWCHPLPPKWRGLAHAAVHGGPVVCLSGGGGESAEPTTCVDMHRAYWNALREPMPLLGDFGKYVATRLPWEKIRKRMGIVEATVNVSPNVAPGYMPALPTRVKGIKPYVYATGQFWGTWTIQHLREAEERGELEVVYCSQAIVATSHLPIFKHFMDFIDREVWKPLGKCLYTRLYGILATRGHFEGHRLVKDGPIEWISRKMELLEKPSAPTYRPDCAAYVTGWNHCTLMRALRGLDEGKTVAVHIDAIWTQDKEGANKLAADGKWRIKRQGPVRYFGTGTYIFYGPDGEECSAPGYDEETIGVPTESRLIEFAAGGNSNQCRKWVNGTPAESKDAISAPLHLEGDGPILAYPSVYDESWSPEGTWNP